MARRREKTDAPFETTVRGASSAPPRIAAVPAPGQQQAVPEPLEAAAAHDPRRRACAVLAIVLAVTFAAALVLPNGMFTLNNRSLTAAWWADVLRANVANLAGLALGQGSAGSVELVVIRYAVIVCAGAGLAASGAVYQGSLRNSLASPTTLGVMAGATTGVTLYALLFESGEFAVEVTSVSQRGAELAAMGFWDYLAAVQPRAFWAAGGALLVAAFVVGVAYAAGRGRLSPLALIITGQVVMGLLGACNTLVRYYLAYTEPGSARSTAMRYLQGDAFGTVFQAYDLVALAAPVALCLGLVMLLRGRIGLLSFGEDEAASMGVRVAALRVGTVAATTLLTAVIVAFCGQIGFLGFFVPHLARRIVGPDLRYLLPASALLGAAFLVAAYWLTTQFTLGASSGVGLFTSVVGGAVFVAVALKSRGRLHDGWN